MDKKEIPYYTNPAEAETNPGLAHLRPSALFPSHLASFCGPDTRPQTFLSTPRRQKNHQPRPAIRTSPLGGNTAGPLLGFWSTSNIDLSCPCFFLEALVSFLSFLVLFSLAILFRLCHQLRVCSVFLFFLFPFFIIRFFVTRVRYLLIILFFFSYHALITFFFSLSLFKEEEFIRLIRLFIWLHITFYLLDGSNKGRNGKRKRTISGNFHHCELRELLRGQRRIIYNPQQWASLSRTTGLGSLCSQPLLVRISLQLHTHIQHTFN